MSSLSSDISFLQLLPTLSRCSPAVGGAVAAQGEVESSGLLWRSSQQRESEHSRPPPPPPDSKTERAREEEFVPHHPRRRRRRRRRRRPPPPPPPPPPRQWATETGGERNDFSAPSSHAPFLLELLCIREYIFLTRKTSCVATSAK